MKIFRTMFALAVMVVFVSCQAGQNLLQMPLNLIKGITAPIGRTLGLSAENTRTPGDLHIDAREAHDAAAAVRDSGMLVKLDSAEPALAWR